MSYSKFKELSKDSIPRTIEYNDDDKDINIRFYLGYRKIKIKSTKLKYYSSYYDLIHLNRQCHHVLDFLLVTYNDYNYIKVQNGMKQNFGKSSNDDTIKTRIETIENFIKIFINHPELIEDNKQNQKLLNTIIHNVKTLVNLTLNNKHSILTIKEKFKLFFDLHNSNISILQFLDKYKPYCIRQEIESKN